jgi:hypothetical protein
LDATLVCEVPVDRRLNARGAGSDKALMAMAHGEIPAEEVRRRFAWARRQGRPAWLWPDVSIQAWRSAQERIASVVTAVLADAPAALDGDPQAIGLAGYTSGTGPLLGLWIEQGRLEADAGVRTVLARHLEHNRVRAARMTDSAADLAAGMAGRGIGLVVLKGAHTGPAYFPEPGARPASDIDLLVSRAEVAAAEAVLQARGLVLERRGRWESTWRPGRGAGRPRTLTYVHAEDPWSVDLHWSLNVALGPASPTARLDRADPLASHARWMIAPAARVLDQPLLLLHLAAHAGAGWHNLTLLRQLELALVIRRDLAERRLDWDAFLALGERTGALGYAYPSLRLCERLVPGTVPDAVLGACAAHAPPAVRGALESFGPAGAQRIDRSSLREHFMWTPGWRGRLRQLASDLFLDAPSWAEASRIYQVRAWRLIRGRVSQ